ncbi:MAG TPA: right-handed parallel beta-helix repeat-containing protein [Polyangiaceae bacterium]|nr:right-handed parallel beta-helix repeat-containing protein [Polyangiaceae bacterium]
MRSLQLFRRALLTGAFVVLPSLAAAAEIHVNGAAAAGGDGTAARPFATIPPAVAAAKPGDQVVIHAGAYPVTTPITVSAKGTAAAPIVIRGEGAVTLRDPSRRIQALQGVLTLSGATYVRVRGLRVEGSGGIGIFVINSQHIVVENNVSVDSWGSGIYALYSTDVAMLRNDVSTCSEGESGAQECVVVADSNGFEVAYNEVHHSHRGKSGGEGIDIKAGAKNGTVHHNQLHDLVRVALYVDAWDKLTENIEIYANRVFHNHAGIGIASEAGGTVRNVRVHDNLIYENGVKYSPVSPDWPYPGGLGITVPDYSGNLPLENLAIYNNTIVRNASSATWGIGIQIAANNVPGLVIRNNILAEHPSAGIDVPSTAPVTIVSNLTFPYTHQSWTHENPGQSYIDRDPLFVNSALFDFHLRAGSPAIDAGSGSPVAALDFDNRARVFGAKVDLGAFEYGSPASGCNVSHSNTAWQPWFALSLLMLLRRVRAPGAGTATPVYEKARS